ncbi:MAG: hypothetical protein U0935_02165 [Pirellulales bacterium]
MLPTRNELMYFALGVTVGGVVGANWSKIKPLLETFMGPAAEGFRDAYADMARKFAETAQTSDEPDEPEVPRRKKKKKKRTRKAPMTAAEFAQQFMFN